MVPPLVPPPPSIAASLGASLAASAAPASASAMQSRFDLQPGAQAVAAQYCPAGQLSFEGKHCTQVSFVVSHQGVAPWHCEFTVHSTHDCATHCSPVGHGCVGLHPGTQEFVLHTVPAAQSVLVRHATQLLLVVLHLPVGALQSASLRQETHALVVVSHFVPEGQVLVGSQPMAQALFTQRWSAVQSADVRHATHDVCASHFCPVGQSALAPHTWHVPLTHTCPFVLVAQSAFDWHPPGPGPSLPGAASAVAPSPLTDASSPLGPTIGLPPPEHPVGKKTMDTSNVTKANAASKRRSRPITAKLSRLSSR